MNPTPPTNDQKREPNCLKCGVVLGRGRGWKYCSPRCRKAYLKANYQKANSEQIAAYNRMYYMQKGKLETACERCGIPSTLGLVRWPGGKHPRLFTLCDGCRAKFLELVLDFQAN